MNNNPKPRFYLTPFDLVIVSSILFLVILTVIAVEYSSGLVDNTKKRVLIVTAVVMDCYKNDTGCEVKAIETNRTDMSNLSRQMHYNKDYFRL